MLGVQPLPLDLAGLDHIGRKSLEHGLRSKRETERFHMTDEPALAEAHCGQRFSQGVPIPLEGGPGRSVMDVYSPHVLR